MKSIISALLFITALSYSAEVYELGAANFDSRPLGKEADGIVGDWVLSSAKVKALVSGDLPLRRPNMGGFYGDGNHTPGGLYDLTLADRDGDQLTILAPCIQKGDVTWIRPLQSDDPQLAGLEVYTSPQTSGEAIAETHHYLVHDDWQGVLIKTILKNTHATEAKKKNIFDHWAQMREQGVVKDIRWANAIDPDDRTAYAHSWVDYDGHPRPTERLTSRGNKQEMVELAAGETLTFCRFVAVGDSPVAAISEIAQWRTDLPTAPITWQLTSADDSAMPRARLAFGPKGPSAYPDASGRMAFSWFAGKHDVELIEVGRQTVKENIELAEDTALERATELPPKSVVAFAVTADGQPTPCKAQFLPRRGTSKPNLGPTDRAHGCVDQWHSETGDFQVALPAGDYTVVLTKGPEYSRHQQIVNLAEGQTVEVTADLQRTVDTTGWVGTDFHNHSTPSGDNTCGVRDRLINLAAEHIEFAPTTEHNRLYDWAPYIEELGLAAHLKTVPGLELTGRGAHLNSFPFQPDPKKQDGGAPVWNADTRVSALTLQNWQKVDDDRWLQINHPDMSDNFIDRDKDGEVDGGFHRLDDFIDAVETQNYRRSHILADAPFSIGPAKTGLGKRLNIQREFIWLQLLNQGLKVWATGVADAHHVHGNGVGSWRTYVPSSTDNPAQIDWREISKNARAGKMILSSGPYLEVSTAAGAIAGQHEATTTGKVDVKVRVQCPDWMAMDRVQVLVNGRKLPKYNYTKASHREFFQEGVVRFDQTLSIDLQEDAHIIVVATSETGDLSALYGTSQQASIPPCAYNNPIFIDTDGDGFQPNGDTLGFDLPVGNLNVQKVEKILKEKILKEK